MRLSQLQELLLSGPSALSTVTLPVVSNHDSSGSSCIGLRYTIQGSSTRTPSNALTIA